MKVILAAGGSGGHIFPSLALSEELEKKGVTEIYFVASKRGLDKRILKNSTHQAFFLSVNPMPFGLRPSKWIIFMAKFIYDAVLSTFLLLRIKPDVVVGFGGYSSGSITRCANFLGIPILIHEQNFVPGRANVILGKMADLIAVSFRETSEYFPESKDKVVFTGNPLRSQMLTKDRMKALSELGLDGGKFTVLFMGGSQGATGLNRIASVAAGIVNDKFPGKVQFVHLTGNADCEAMKDFYATRHIKAAVFAFLDRMDYAYAASDMAVTRSGAAAVFELALYGRPMVLVPYPNPKNSQRTNAVYFAQKGAAIYREENDLTAENLSEDILKMMLDTNGRNEMSKKALALARPDAGECFASEIMKIVNTKKE